MATKTSRTPLRLLTVVLWTVFLGGNALLFSVDALPGGMSPYLLLSWLLVLLLCWLALLVRYFRRLGQWRALLLLWIVCTLALLAASFANRQGMAGLATIGMTVAVYSIFAAWFATLALAIRRDVSVAYLALFFLVAPMVFRAGMLASGGVLAIFQGPPPGSQSLPFIIGQTTVMALTFMPTLAFLTFIPHFVWLWVKEWRRQPLPGQKRANPTILIGHG